MKKYYILLVVLLMSAMSFAQAPEMMSYQAVIRNSSNVLLTSAPVGMKISILQGSVSGTAVYVETQTPTTNNNGLVTLAVGSGTPVLGIFAGINWSTGPYFIKTETDPLGGTTYTITGTSQLMSVPYALYAAKSGDSRALEAQVANLAINFNTSSNLFDESAVLEADKGMFLGSTGSKGVLAGNAISPYIPIEYLQTAILDYYDRASYLHLCFYTSTKDFISSVPQNTISSGITGVANAKYFRFNFSSRYLGAEVLQAEYGTSRTLYKPFGYSLKESFIKNSYGNNLFDKSKVYNGTTSQFDGYLAGLGTDRSSRLVKIKTGASIFSNSDYNCKVIEYDINGGFLRGFSGVLKTIPLVLGANTEYIRLVCDVSLIDTIFFRNSTVPIDYNYYEPYTETLEQPTREVAITNDICLPKKIYSFSDVTLFLKPFERRYENISQTIRFGNLSNFSDKAIATISGNLDVTATLYDENFLAKKQTKTTLTLASTATSTGSVIINPFGDSITLLGAGTNGHFNLLSTYVPNATFVGTYTSIQTGIKHEGRPGWTLKQYMEIVHSPAEWAGFSPFLHPTDLTLRYLGCTKFWISAYALDPWNTEMKAKGEALGGFDPTTGLKLSPVTNDVMYQYSANAYKKWDGSTWVTITAPTFTFNYAKYLSVWGLATPTFVPIMLGTNDYGVISELTANASFNATWVANMNTVVASIQSAAPSAKIGVIIPPYNTTLKCLNGRWTSPINASLWAQRKLIIDTYDNRGSEKIYVIDFGTALDTEKDFAVDGNGFVTDPVHPSNYTNLAKRLGAWIQATR